MRHILGLWIVAACVGCSVITAPITQQRMLVLPNGQFQVGGAASDLSSAMKRLGTPQTTQVNLVGCRKTTYMAIVVTNDTLARAGYTRIGFAKANGAELALCQDEP